MILTKTNGKKEENAMSNKKFPKLAVLSLLGLLTLTSCGSSDDEIKSLPSNYDDPIITIKDETEEIHNNLISIIADQFQEGDLPSKTLDKVLYRYAQSVYGAYNKVARADKDESTTLKEATRIVVKKFAHDVDPDQEAPTEKEIATLYAFIREHKTFWHYNDKKQHIDHEGKVIADDKNFTPCEEELENVLSRFQDVEKRIAENMYSKAKNGGYTTKHFFKEYEFVKSLYDAGEKVIHYKDAKKDPRVIPTIIDYNVEEKDVFDEGILHRDFYQTHYGIDDDETKNEFYTDVDPDTGEEIEVDLGYQYHYIEEQIVPQIYSDLLVEQYLLDKESDAVKQSRARQINVIKIEKNGEFDIAADYLIRELVDEIYSVKPTGEYYAFVDEDHNPYQEIFEKYEDISKGLTTIVNTRDPAFPVEPKIDPVTEKENPKYWNEEQIIYRINQKNSNAFKYATSSAESGSIAYYKNTKFGDLVEDYEKFLSAASYDAIDTSLLNKFTSNGTCTPEEGLDQEKITLSQVEAITRGWYIEKSSPSLDSNGKIKKNLFQLSVANNKLEAKNATDPILRYDLLGGVAAVDRYHGQLVGEGTDTEHVEWSLRSDKVEDENKYVCSINGAYFLKFDGQSAGRDYKDDIVCEDKSGNAYYICQVIEAVKDVKLRNSDSPNSYANTREAGFLNKVISEVTTKVAETGSYSSLSKEYWLEKMNLYYHDQNVYDYFKSNYPDLFDDED